MTTNTKMLSIDSDFSMRKAVRNFVPASAPAVRVLRDLQRRRTQLAVVVDERGGVAGILTLQAGERDLTVGLLDPANGKAYTSGNKDDMDLMLAAIRKVRENVGELG